MSEVADSDKPTPTERASTPCMSTAVDSPPDPGYAQVRRFLTYSLSLPERAIRSSVGVAGGLLRESSDLLLPQAFRSSKTYTVMIQQMLDYLVEDVGGVEKRAAEGEQAIENFVARKAVGNFVEMAGLATLHVSPLTVLAIISDLAYGSRTYLKELSDELKREGVIEQHSTIESLDDLLSAVGHASSVTATAFDTPPLSVEGLKETIAQTRDALKAIDPARVIPQAEIQQLWSQMRDVANRERVGLFEVSSAVTLGSLSKIATVGRGSLSGARVAGNLFDRHVIDHYRQALGEIQARGLYQTLAESSQPYIKAVWRNFSGQHATWTERLVSGEWIVAVWSDVRGLLGKRPA